MRLKNIGLGLLLAATSTGIFAQELHKSYHVSKAGTLISLLTEDEANSITHLTLTGKINAEDFKHLRDEFKNLQVLDLANADIKMYTGRGGTYPERVYVYMGNFIPAYAFCRVENGQYIGKESLQKVILSEKIRNIEDAAFKGCNNLEICEIRRKTAPNLLSEALADSLTAIVIPLGCGDEYRKKKNWENFAFIEGQVVTAHFQVGLMGSLEEEMQKKGIQPKEINFLTIEGKLDEADFKIIRDYMPNLVSVDIARTLAKRIPPFTFAQKKYMLRIQLPNQLESIGERAFSGCTRLTGTIYLPATVNALEYGAFTGCNKLHQVTAQGNKLTTIGDDVFGTGDNKKLHFQKE